MENCDAIFGEETAGPGESPAPTDTCTGMSRQGDSSQPGTRHPTNLTIKRTTAGGIRCILLYVFCFLDLCLEEQSGSAGGAEEDQQAKTCVDASSSLPHLVEEDGADPVVEAQRAEVRQLHKHWDNTSRRGRKFLVRLSSCCASS